MKNTIKVLGIIALAAIIGFSMIACKDGDDGDGGVINVPNVTDLPDFPAGSTPAASEATAKQILAVLKQSNVFGQLGEEAYDCIDNLRGDDHRYENYSFSNKSFTNEKLKLSASGNGNDTMTGGFKEMDDLYKNFDGNYNDRNAAEALIQFNVGDKDVYSYREWIKGEVTSAKTISGVTFASGSIFETSVSESGDMTVSTAGTSETMRINGSFSEKDQTVIGCTVSTTSGSIKIILDITGEESATGKNTNWNFSIGDVNDSEKYSGSLKVYGNNNALLIEQPVNNLSDYNKVEEMIGSFNY